MGLMQDILPPIVISTMAESRLARITFHWMATYLIYGFGTLRHYQVMKLRLIILVKVVIQTVVHVRVLNTIPAHHVHLHMF